MLTANERIERLEEDLAEARMDIAVAASLSINLLQAALDQLVDERILAAATRTEIWGRIRTDLDAISAGSERVSRAALRAVPRYATREERENSRRLLVEFSREEERVRKEILKLPKDKPEADQ